MGRFTSLPIFHFCSIIKFKKMDFFQNLDNLIASGYFEAWKHDFSGKWGFCPIIDLDSLN